MTAPGPELHTLQIPDRPRRTWAQLLNTLLFGLVFDAGLIIANMAQFMFLLPLRLLPFSWTQALYAEGLRHSKGSFGSLLILMSQWFAPTKLSINFEREGSGAFTEEQIASIIVRDGSGNVTALNLPTKYVLIANHQVYADWWYMWCLSYFIGTHRDVFIVLKKSLKWLPIVGWGMQFFDFVFLARSWASDRLYLARHLSSLAKDAEKTDKPLSLIVYPEGTLVSKDTRPISKKFAEKQGITDLANVLLPRSTGLHYCLRSLACRIPSLKLIDVTMVYPGIPPMGYGQSYYTLRSIFCDRVPPPVIHLHLRIFDVASEVPIGNLSDANPSESPRAEADVKVVEVDYPEQEKVQFDSWLLQLWRDKDESMNTFFNSGSFEKNEKRKGKGADAVIPLELRSKLEVPYCFVFFLPVMVGWLSMR